MKFRTRTAGALIALTTVFGLVGCTENKSEAPPQAPASETIAQQQGPDTPIEVKPLLIRNGFKETRILPIMVNAAYWVAPFATAMELEQDGNNAMGGCIFKFTREDYKSGPISSYTFSTHNNVAKIQARTLNPQGAMGPDLPETVTMPLEKLTPQSLKDAFQGQLSKCGDTTLR